MRDDSSITPDTKNWTWVLSRRCPECGLDAGRVAPAGIATMTRTSTAAADRFDAVADDQWGRTARRSDGARFTVASLGQYAVHDWVHHVHDVREAGAEP